MADTTEVTPTRREYLLRFIEAMVTDLPWVVAEWDDLGEGEWVGFCLDWDLALLTNLVELRHDSRCGRLTQAEQARLDAVTCAIRDAQPLLDSRDLVGLNDVVSVEAKREARVRAS